MVKYLKLLFVLFNIGIFGILGTKRHLILILMAFEIVLVGLGIWMVIFSVYMDDLLGSFYTIILYTVGAAESAVGLILLVLFFKINGSLSTDFVNKLGEHFFLFKG